MARHGNERPGIDIWFFGGMVGMGSNRAEDLRIFLSDSENLGVFLDAGGDSDNPGNSGSPRAPNYLLKFY
jgi:hypothetical protein